MKPERIKHYFKANPGALFVIAFEALLASAATVLVLGDSPTANKFAIYAFYTLAVGVAIQVGVLFKERGKRTRATG